MDLDANNDPLPICTVLCSQHWNGPLHDVMLLDVLHYDRYLLGVFYQGTTRQYRQSPRTYFQLHVYLDLSLLCRFIHASVQKASWGIRVGRETIHDRLYGVCRSLCGVACEPAKSRKCFLRYWLGAFPGGLWISVNCNGTCASWCWQVVSCGYRRFSFLGQLCIPTRVSGVHGGFHACSCWRGFHTVAWTSRQCHLYRWPDLLHLGFINRRSRNYFRSQACILVKIPRDQRISETFNTGTVFNKRITTRGANECMSAAI
mmetsp:Transcript_118546/g.236108  ORF Transcript_118546/g.236108 Transcript_118546/m.236108 type:complete len:259 (+) Transcript_118546:27-803(+)